MGGRVLVDADVVVGLFDVVDAVDADVLGAGAGAGAGLGEGAGEAVGDAGAVGVASVGLMPEASTMGVDTACLLYTSRCV